MTCLRSATHQPYIHKQTKDIIDAYDFLDLVHYYPKNENEVPPTNNSAIITRLVCTACTTTSIININNIINTEY